MGFEFHEASCVIVGTFNIYIIRPDWLARIGLLPDASAVQYETQLTQPGFRLSSDQLGSRWTVLPNRLVLDTKNPTEDCGATADLILDRLPETPLTAIGFNVVLRGDPASIGGWDDKTTFPSSVVPSEGYECKQRSWHLGVGEGDHTINLQLSELQDYVELRANIHFDLKDRRSEFARQTARDFFAHRQKCISLLRDLFQARIDDAANND